MTTSVLKIHFRKLPPEVINYRIFKNLAMKGLWIPYIILSVKSNSKSPDQFFEISQNLPNKHAPRKKKYIRGNNKPFMTKAYSKAIM